jgi:chromosome segregation ATPase
MSEPTELNVLQFHEIADLLEKEKGARADAERKLSDAQTQVVHLAKRLEEEIDARADAQTKLDLLEAELAEMKQPSPSPDVTPPKPKGPPPIAHSNESVRRLYGF